MKYFLFSMFLFLGLAWQVPKKKQIEAEWWLTTADRTSLLVKQNNLVGPAQGVMDQINIDEGKTYQSIEGFGYTLTGASTMLINAMAPASRTTLLKELFDRKDGIGISYLRISVGASDLHTDVFTYDDIPEGQTDPGLQHFSLDRDNKGGTGLIPLLKEILKIQPSLQILASPWTAPIWMKDNQSFKGGHLRKSYYSTYANYLVSYVKKMKAEGITINALTPQNEPLHGGNVPSMVMQAPEQAEFIRDHLGPAFEKAGLKTKIIVYDHNCNKPEYPISILNDAVARKYIAGSAFHLYEGDIEALSLVKKAHPDKDLYFTEQWTGSKGSFDGDLMWHMKNVVIGSMNNWSRTALEWNLANDSAFSMHTPGGCTECKGALTIIGNNVERNVAYYIIAHASKFVSVGSVRIGSSGPGALPSVAFKTPAGKIVLIVLNEGNVEKAFEIKKGADGLKASMPAQSVATYVMQG
jgi:glucosylceramidase